MGGLAKVVLLGGIASILSGCASWGEREYSCPGRPDGVMCQGVSSVYRMTNNRDNLHPEAGPAGKEENADPLLSQPGAMAGGMMLQPLAGPLPVREPAEVMRIWIGPWIDSKQDLHWPSYVFTEVTPRQWSFGEAAAINAPVIVPLQVEAASGTNTVSSQQPPR